MVLNLIGESKASQDLPGEPPETSASEVLPTHLEIERKWLVKELPDLSAYSFEEILQGYLPPEKEGQEKRIRAHGGKFDLTIKGDGDLVREETSPIHLTKEAFEALWQETNGKSLQKTRYSIPFEGLNIELDIYSGALTGLLVVEVEFKSVRESELFAPPDWFGSEVTHDKRYKNKQLAGKGLP